LMFAFIVEFKALATNSADTQCDAMLNLKTAAIRRFASHVGIGQSQSGIPLPSDALFGWGLPEDYYFETSEWFSIFIQPITHYTVWKCTQRPFHRYQPQRVYYHNKGGKGCWKLGIFANSFSKNLTGDAFKIHLLKVWKWFIAKFSWK
jgi:hypothetical protein